MTHTNLLALYIQMNNFGRTLGMTFEILEKGKIKYMLTVDDSHLSTPIAAHGGMLAGLMDGALGVAGLSQVEDQGKIVSTVEFKINYLKPASKGDKLIALAEVVSAGKKILYIEGEIFRMEDDEKVLICKGAGTFNAYPAEKARLV